MNEREGESLSATRIKSINLCLQLNTYFEKNGRINNSKMIHETNREIKTKIHSIDGKSIAR